MTLSGSGSRRPAPRGTRGTTLGTTLASVWGMARSCYPQSLVYSTEQWKMRNSGGVLLCMLAWWPTEPVNRQRHVAATSIGTCGVELPPVEALGAVIRLGASGDIGGGWGRGAGGVGFGVGASSSACIGRSAGDGVGVGAVHAGSAGGAAAGHPAGATRTEAATTGAEKTAGAATTAGFTTADDTAGGAAAAAKKTVSSAPQAGATPVGVSTTVGTEAAAVAEEVGVSVVNMAAAVAVGASSVYEAGARRRSAPPPARRTRQVGPLPVTAVCFAGGVWTVAHRARCFVRVMFLVGPDLCRLLRLEGGFGLPLMWLLLPLSSCARAPLLQQ